MNVYIPGLISKGDDKDDPFENAALTAQLLTKLTTRMSKEMERPPDRFKDLRDRAASITDDIDQINKSHPEIDELDIENYTTEIEFNVLELAIIAKLVNSEYDILTNRLKKLMNEGSPQKAFAKIYDALLLADINDTLEDALFSLTSDSVDGMEKAIKEHKE